MIDIIIFAKAPIAGQVKTRLIPALGAAGAAHLAAHMLEHTVTAARAAGLGAVELCLSPGAAHPDWAGQLPQHPDLRIHDQGDGDLGERMARAMERVLSAPRKRRMPFPPPEGARKLEAARRFVDNHAPVGGALRGALLIGTDCADMSAALLREAARLLRDADACLLPCEDGGYALIGMTRYAPEAFRDIAWSTSEVAATTLARLRALNWKVAIGPTVRDIDTPADLNHLQTLANPL